MFDLGWSELLLVAVVAIIVVGPKELPRALRTVGQWAAKVRGVAREFQNSVDDMIRESELEELRRETQSLASFNLDEEPRNSIGSGEGGGFEPPVEAEEEAEADEAARADEAYAVEGTMAPAHSLSEPEPPPEPGPADDRPADVGGRQGPERAGTRANG